VDGGDGGLANKGQAALQGNDAAQSVINAGKTNPTPAIDPNAPFITIGKNAESTADGIMNGTSQQCKETTVSKSTFENFPAIGMWPPSRRAEEQPVSPGIMRITTAIRPP
jgi:conjugal transfer mating pair stabilization protein TraN